MVSIYQKDQEQQTPEFSVTYNGESLSMLFCITALSPSLSLKAIVTSSLKSVMSVGVEVVSTDSYVVGSSGGGGVLGGCGTESIRSGDSRSEL